MDRSATGSVDTRGAANDNAESVIIEQHSDIDAKTESGKPEATGQCEAAPIEASRLTQEQVYFLEFIFTCHKIFF